MEIERNKFFREASLHICSSLDFGQAIERTRRFLSDLLPLDGLYVNLVESGGTATRTMAAVNEESGLRRNIPIPLTPEAVEYIQEFLRKKAKRTLDAARISRDSSSSVMGSIEGPILGYEGREIMVQRLNIAGEYFGTLIASSKQGRQFNEEHLALYASLNQPFSIALANALSYEKANNLKDRLAEENRFLAQELQTHQEFTIIGAENGMKNVVEMVEQVAPLSNTVLLLGETGTGKEIVANAIHKASKRSGGPFIKVNCGAIPENLIDSELFGHEKGAFTGAAARKKGRFERADGGTIFLDEIGELPLPAQVRLLRVLQTKEIERVGGSEPIPVDIRIIAATHRKLEQMISENKFREDLWYRINIFPIIIPPLRQRNEDIPLLVEHFVNKKAREMGLRKVPKVAAETLQQLSGHSWPGNVRELENVVERALIQNRDQNLRIDPYIFAVTGDNQGPESGHGSHCMFPCLAKNAKTTTPQQISTKIPLTLDEAMARQIRETLKHTKGKVGGEGGAAKILGLNSSTLRNRMNKLGISYGKKAADEQISEHRQ